MNIVVKFIEYRAVKLKIEKKKKNCNSKRPILYIYECTFIFQEGLVIIDTPGFGENQIHKSLKKYLAKSCGFIYVVNTANAGGVQRGRVCYSVMKYKTSIVKTCYRSLN